MTLYADVEYLKQAIDSLIAQCPEIADDEILRTDMLEGSTEIERVFTSVLKSIREDKIVVAGIDTIVNDLEARKVRALNRKEAKRNLLASLMERTNLKKFTLPEATLSVSWRQPAPVVVDRDILPEAYWKVERSPDMAAIKQAVTDHGVYPLGTAPGNGQNVLTIRIK